MEQILAIIVVNVCFADSDGLAHFFDALRGCLTQALEEGRLVLKGIIFAFIIVLMHRSEMTAGQSAS